MKIFRNTFRVFFLILLVIEVLAWVNVIDIELEFTWRGLVGTLATVWFFLELFSWYFRKKGKGSLHPSAYGVAFLSIALDALGDIHRWYGSYAWYDQIMHLLGGITSVIVIWSIFDRLIKKEVKKIQRFIPFALAFGFASLAGILYEGEEYLEDVFTGSNRLGSGFDTANDLLLNVTGHLIGICILYLLRSRKKT